MSHLPDQLKRQNNVETDKDFLATLDLATEVEIIARRLNLIIHDKVINILDSQWAMFNVSRCIDNRYSVKIHETNIVMVKY